MNYNWTDLAFGNKNKIRDLRAIFVAAPRNMSAARLTQIIKTYLPQGNILFGIAKEDYIDGFAGQPQFATLQKEQLQPLIDKVQGAGTKYSVGTLSYFQRELPFLLEKLSFKKVLFVRGSWHRAFHLRPEYYILTNHRIDFELVSPFTDETEAKAYARTHIVEPPPHGELLTEKQMMQRAAQEAMHSFDNSYQTGTALGKKRGTKYELLTTSFNCVVPYQTYAWHFGASREINFSPPHDLNHYDTVHAEVNLMIKAQQECINLNDTTLFINLLPCPACARMFTQTDIAEFVYSADHSDGYAVQMLETAGKKVRRVVL